MKVIWKKTFMMLFLGVCFCSVFVIKNNMTSVEANNNLEPVLKADGTQLKYRNSNEVVYGLKEYDYPTSEFRGVWISHFAGDLGSYTTETAYKNTITNILDDVESMGINTIIFHIRTHNNAMYKSNLNPKASWWSRVDFDVFDPLTWIIEETHKRGMEFHAWLNPYRTASSGGGQVPASNYVGTIPDANPAKNSANLLNSSSGAILDPSKQEVRDFLVDTCMEVIENYDIDAIHFDDYFYIDGLPSSVGSDDFRRAQVDAFIKQLSTTVRSYNNTNNRAVQIGISPSNVYRNGSYYSGNPQYDANGSLINPIGSNTGGFAHYGSYLFSDTKKWVDEEWIDYIMPQAYHALEHMSASFAEIARWWSWVVANKKVNLYLGMGIYFVHESGTSASYWKLDSNEIKKQLHVAGALDQINGLGFYKYASLKDTSVPLIKNTRDLISNDYWAKKIPGAVIPYYADKLASVPVSNLTYRSNTLSWDVVNNVFGYMVYRVPKGQQLDINNINHLYEYVQTNSINIDSISGYDFYVSTVNRANVVSEPVLYNNIITDPVEVVIDLIEGLKEQTDYLKIEELIIDARTKYNNLNEEQKVLVTNFRYLLIAEENLEYEKEFQTKYEDFISNLDPHIKDDRIIRIPDGMSLGLKNQSDEVYYNVGTGKRGKKPLQSNRIELILTMYANNGHTKEFSLFINTGLLSWEQTGLFYRNDASSMGVDDFGNIKPGETGYIGWSEATISIGNNVLFVASGNYFVLNSSSDIKIANWTSCAAVLKNNSNNVINVPLSSVFDTTSLSGYFIIDSNNKIRLVNADDDIYTKSVALQKDEVLVIMRFLDTQIVNSPWAPTTKLTVGTEARLNYYGEENITETDKINRIIELINALPIEITLANKMDVNNILDLYNQLLDESKSKVTNYSILENAIKRIEYLEESLLEYRANAINILRQYLDISKYSQEKLNIINDILNVAIGLINNNELEVNIDQIVIDTKLQLDLIETLEDELNSEKIKAKQNLVSSIEKLGFNDAELVYINEKITEYNNAIDACNDINALNQKYNEIVIEVTKFANDLHTGKKEILKELPTYILSLGANSYEAIYLNELANNFKNKLNNEVEVSNLTKIYNDFKNEASTYIRQLLDAKANLKQYMSDISSENFDKTQKEKLNLLISSITQEIEKARLIDTVNELKADFIAKYNNIKEATQSSSCANSASYIIQIFTCITLIGLILRRKNR